MFVRGSRGNIVEQVVVPDEEDQNVNPGFSGFEVPWDRPARGYRSGRGWRRAKFGAAPQYLGPPNQWGIQCPAGYYGRWALGPLGVRYPQCYPEQNDHQPFPFPDIHYDVNVVACSSWFDKWDGKNCNLDYFKAGLTAVGAIALLLAVTR